jgi:hypothetical protein
MDVRLPVSPCLNSSFNSLSIQSYAPNASVASNQDRPCEMVFAASERISCVEYGRVIT